MTLRLERQKKVVAAAILKVSGRLIVAIRIGIFPP